MSKPLDETLSIEIAKRIKSKPTDCFDNAYKAALLTEGAMYVQGFLTFAGDPYVPVEYSWIENFAAHRLSVKQLKAAVEEAKEDYPDDDPLPIYGAAPYEHYGELMLGGNDYKDAYKEAEAKCRELNKPKTPGALP